MGCEDSTGKSKIVEAKARSKGLVTMFLISLCLGMVVAERLYISRRGGGLMAASTAAAAQLVHLGHRKVSAGSGAPGEYHGPPRNDLEELLRKIAPSKEVLVAVSNKNYLWGSPAMLNTFTSGFARAKISNHLVLALDEETKRWCDEHKVNAYLLQLEVHKAQANTGENHAVSAMKFGILKRFLDLGWSVLLSDVDIAILQDPFRFLYRDSDVEGMTDGFDDRTAYGGIEGFDDPSMGWARSAQYYKHFNLNSGLFYLKANERTIELMRRLDDRLSKTKYWDQTAYNEEIFFLSHGEYKSPQVSVRVMELDKFMNSKRLFKDVRMRPKANLPPMPVMVHINYHPDKHERMQAVVKYYIDGDEHALDKFPGGSEAGSR